MTVEVDVQIATEQDDLPQAGQIESWVRLALGDRETAELTVRLVGLEESAALNERFRSRTGPTNVLSFPAELPAGVDLPFLGDVVICAPLVQEEAACRNKDPRAHWAHLVVHGVLHLQGYDHGSDREAERMESLEVRLLAELGYPDPYA